MAQKVTYVDDIDGTEGAEPVRFAFRGQDYEIDLAEKNRDKLTKALEPYIAAARAAASTAREVTPLPKTGTRRRSSGAAASGVDLPALREWAAANNVELPKRGRISKAIITQYQDSKAS